MKDASRALDVVVLGATGDTGSAAVRLLYHHATKFHINAWAPAARNLSNLVSRVLNPLGVCRWSSPIQTDSDDLHSIIDMCRQTRVVVTCAGPYAKYGEKVIAACIQSGTHYVDITGEVNWVSRMKQRYGYAAKKAGVSIVSFCGYDSVPMDMSAWMLADALRKASDEAAIIETFAATHSKGGGDIPTGTINTVLLQANSMRHRFSFGLFGAAAPVHEEVKAGTMHHGVHVGGEPLLTAAVKHRVDRDSKVNGGTYKSDLVEDKPVWSSPHFMATINMPVVHATAVDKGFEFEYRERSLSGGRQAWEPGHNEQGPSVLSKLTTPLMYLAAVPVVMSPWFETAVWWYVNRSNAKGKENSDNATGHNMVQRLMTQGETTGFVGVRGYAKGKNGKIAVSNFESEYDAGIGSTMLYALAVAGALVQKPIVAGTGGFETPVCAVGGETLRGALSDAGVKVDVYVKGPQAKL